MQLKVNPLSVMVMLVTLAVAFLLGIGYSNNGQFRDSFLQPQRNPSKLDLLTETLIFVMNLQVTERKIFSQNKEDGVLEAIFKRIGVKYKYYVEFGVESGKECSTRIFRERYGWKGLLMDGGFSKPKINLRKEMITPSNIIQLFQKYNVPKKFDLLGVDTDFKDFWILKKILHSGYRPRVIIGEINAFLGPTVAKTIPLNHPQKSWDLKTQYYGYSVLAGWMLGRRYGYSMVYCENRGANCFWVIDGAEGFGEGIQISRYVNGSALWKTACCLYQKRDVRNRTFTTITADSIRK